MQERRENVRFLEQKLMHEHFFVALTLEKLLRDPAEAAHTCLTCLTYAATVDRHSASKAIQMIAKRQTKLRLTATQIKEEPSKQAFLCL